MDLTCMILKPDIQFFIQPYEYFDLLAFFTSVFYVIYVTNWVSYNFVLKAEVICSL